MAQITGNTCNIITISPMIVDCLVTNATNAITQDGSIQLIINGGEAPYTISWSNGQQGNVLNNLSPGNYTATVTDYYGDYTIIKTCTVLLQSQSDTGSYNPYLDKFFKCNDSYNPDVYVFYDGTTLDINKLSLSSETIRSWYNQKVLNGFGGQLYEGVIGGVNNNGKDWLWWSTYPYLGSLTGGTLSDSTLVKSFSYSGNSVNNSIYDSNWCQSSDSGKCVPNNTSFNFSTNVAGGLTSDIYKRINHGFQLTGSYGVDDSRSNGVPFTITSSMDGNDTGIYGDFIGGQTEYIVLIITNNSNGEIGMYHGDTPIDRDSPQKSFLFTNPFELYGDEWNIETEKEYTNRFSYDYESFLKVWEDIKSQNGRFDGLIYPYITNTIESIPFLQHLIASVEGDVITNNDFEDKYGTNIQNVGPQNLNLLTLQYENVYSGLTATTTYNSLPSIYKNGAGLKNFGWIAEPTAQFNNGTNINTKIEQFFDGTALSDDVIYTNTLPNMIAGKIYNLNGINGCYSYDSYVLNTGQTFTNTEVIASYNDCINCDPSPLNPVIQPVLCLTSTESQYTFTQTGIDSNGYFTWVNTENSLTIQYNIINDRWEITPWSNISSGLMIQNSNNVIPTGLWNNIGNARPLTWSITEGTCSGIPITLTAQPNNETCEGDNNGLVTLIASGGQPPFVYRIPNVPPYPAYQSSGLFINLSPDSYIGEVSGSTGTASTSFVIGDGGSRTEYIVSTTYQQQNLNYGTLSWAYSLQITPPLPSNVTLNFDLELTHQRIERDSGFAIFNQSHQIVKNGNINISYTTTSPTTTTTTVCNGTVIESNETFKQVSSSVQINGSDTLVGNVSQTVIIDGSGASCTPSDCKMLGKYITSLQLKNLSLSGGNNCDSVTYPNPLTNINVTEEDCSA